MSEKFFPPKKDFLAKFKAIAKIFAMIAAALGALVPFFNFVRTQIDSDAGNKPASTQNPARKNPKTPINKGRIQIDSTAGNKTASTQNPARKNPEAPISQGRIQINSTAGNAPPIQ